MGVRIRPADPSDAGAMARVHVDTWRSTYGGIVPAKHLASLSCRDRESKWFDILTTASPNTSNFVAETESGDVVGFADGGPEREGNQTYRGELYAVYVLERYQRRGVGHRLVSAVAQRLISDGMYSMLVWVLQGNGPACRFYESLGGQRVGRQTIAIWWSGHRRAVIRLEEHRRWRRGCPSRRTVVALVPDCIQPVRHEDVGMPRMRRAVTDCRLSYSTTKTQ